MYSRAALLCYRVSPAKRGFIYRLAGFVIQPESLASLWYTDAYAQSSLS